MSDLISRSALLARYDRIHVGAPGAARKMIEDAPTVDAVPVDKIYFTDLYLANGEAIATFKFGNQGITIRKKCEDVYTEEDVRDAYTGGYSCGMEQGMEKAVVHGRWIPTYHKYYNRDGECLIADEWHCSECGVRHRDKWNYCPNCGTKMDGERKDDDTIDCETDG